MEQVISGNYSYLQKPAPRTNYTLLGATMKANNCRMKSRYMAEKSDETMIFFICRLLFFDFKKKAGS